MKLGSALVRLRELETELADDYRAVGERHAADHDVYHLCRSLALQCEEHARRLEPVAARYGEDVESDGDGGTGLWSGVLERVRRAASHVGDTPQAGLLLLRDLRSLFLSAEECSITWVMVGQAAQAARDRELLDLVRECHTETEIQVKWLTTRIKVAAPQALATG
jgi:hypothetical protein